jgi:hypothetical protein
MCIVHPYYVMGLTEHALAVIGAPLQSCIGCTAGSTFLAFLAFLVLMMLLAVDAALTPLDVIGSSSR